MRSFDVSRHIGQMEARTKLSDPVQIVKKIAANSIQIICQNQCVPE